VEQMGKYQLIRKLASGGMAEVFLARSAGPLGFEKQLVVKRILPHLTEDPQFVEMFLAEARLAALLNHAHIAQIFDFGQQDGRYFIAMEYIEGHNLRVLCRKAHERGLRLPFALCARLISMACEGLAYAHELTDPRHGKPLGLIHRDISADNLLLSRTGILKVVDFGIAKAASTWIPRTQTGLIKGKVAYMPPEQLLGRPLDARADLYALAVVLYELVTGRRPYEGESDVSLIQCILNEPMRDVQALREDMPKELEQIINRALSKDRESRQASCRELQQELERFVIRCGEPVGPYQLAELVQQLSESAAVSAEPEATPGPVAHSMVAPTEPNGTQPVPAQRESATEPMGTQPLPREAPQPTAAERKEPLTQPLPGEPSAQPTTVDRPQPPPLPTKAPPPAAARRPSRERKSATLPWRRAATWGAPCMLLLVVLVALWPGQAPTEVASQEFTAWREVIAGGPPPSETKA
jgi:eukaryotic-like serine/threonine-protein kinase